MCPSVSAGDSPWEHDYCGCISLYGRGEKACAVLTHEQCSSVRGSQACGRGGKGAPSKVHNWLFGLMF
eukprot:scaffold30275_cov21-Tisochrysis_lutea.AAC.2